MQRAEEAIPNPKSAIPYLISAPEPLKFAAQLLLPQLLLAILSLLVFELRFSGCSKGEACTIVSGACLSHSFRAQLQIQAQIRTNCFCKDCSGLG